jgi:hypothetical protein
LYCIKSVIRVRTAFGHYWIHSVTKRQAPFEWACRLPLPRCRNKFKQIPGGIQSGPLAGGQNLEFLQRLTKQAAPTNWSPVSTLHLACTTRLCVFYHRWKRRAGAGRHVHKAARVLNSQPNVVSSRFFLFQSGSKNLHLVYIAFEPSSTRVRGMCAHSKCRFFTVLLKGLSGFAKDVPLRKHWCYWQPALPLWLRIQYDFRLHGDITCEKQPTSNSTIAWFARFQRSPGSANIYQRQRRKRPKQGSERV